MANGHSQSETPERKLTHLRTTLERDVSFPRVTTGLERYHFQHRALPEMDWDEVSLRCSLLDHSLRAPLLISSMTGGANPSGGLSPHDINLRLARAAQEFGLAFAVGSQRAAIENPELAGTYQVRRVAPDVLLLANLGAVQLNYGFGVSECRRAVEMIGADALIVHLNPLQEYLQHKGNLNFSGLLDKIGHLCQSLGVPVVAKEVGWGISAPVAQDLVEVGVSAIDVAGAGGTSWIEVEGQLTADPVRRRVATVFADWGIPTAEALVRVRAVLPDTPLIASGGIRTGLDVATSIALGAELAGIAGPLLNVAHSAFADVRELVWQILQEIRLVMFATGSTTVSELRRPELLARE
jgi:isopentenyl-diphosphate delta-isomerase